MWQGISRALFPWDTTRAMNSIIAKHGARDGTNGRAVAFDFLIGESAEFGTEEPSGPRLWGNVLPMSGRVASSATASTSKPHRSPFASLRMSHEKAVCREKPRRRPCAGSTTVLGTGFAKVPTPRCARTPKQGWRGRKPARQRYSVTMACGGREMARTCPSRCLHDGVRQREPCHAAESTQAFSTPPPHA